LFDLEPPIWVSPTGETVFGWLPTPTATANQWAPSMKKWPSCATLQKHIPSDLACAVFEALMDWPEGWADSEPLEMDKFREWQSRHGTY